MSVARWRGGDRRACWRSWRIGLAGGAQPVPSAQPAGPRPPAEIAYRKATGPGQSLMASSAR